MKDRRSLLTILAGQATAAPATYSISGTVYDADGTTAVASATVALGAASTTSGVDGTYSITGLAAGTSGSLTCTKSGYSWTAITVSAMSGNLTSQNFTNVWYAAGGSLASCVIAYQPVGAADLASSYINLANPGTYNASVFPAKNAPLFAAATGWEFSGAGSTVLTTSYIPPDQVTRSMIMRISGGTTSTSYICGTRSTSGSNYFTIQGANASTVALFRNGSNAYTHSAAVTAGVVAIAGLDPYLDGVDLGNITAGTYALTHELVIGAYNLAGTTSNAWTGFMQAFALYTSTLTSTQIGIMTTAMAALP